MAKLPDGWIFMPRMNEHNRLQIYLEQQKLVTCKSCTYWDDSSEVRFLGGWCFCDKLQFSTSPDWFCADGEAKKNAAD